MKKLLLILLLINLSNLYSNTNNLEKAINELANLNVIDYNDDRNETTIDRIKEATSLITHLYNENRFDIHYYDIQEIIIEKNIQLILNEKGDGFYLQIPDRLLSDEYYDLLLVTLAKYFIEVLNIFTIKNYYNIVQNNYLEKYLYDMDSYFVQYILLTEYINGKYPIKSKWCNEIVLSQNNNNLKDVSEGIYFLNNEIIYRVYGMFRKYAESGDISILNEIIDYIDKTDLNNQINLNSIIFVNNYLNYNEIAVNYSSELLEDGSRNIIVSELDKHTDKIEIINTMMDELRTKIDADLMNFKLKDYENEILIQ